MFKYLVLVAFFAMAVSAAPPAPEAPKDLDTANQLLYGAYPGYASVYSGGYPSVYSGYSAYGAYPYAAYGGYRAGYVYGR